MQNNESEIVAKLQELLDTSPRAYAAFMASIPAPCPMDREGEHDCKECWLEYIELAERDPGAALDLILGDEK